MKDHDKMPFGKFKGEKMEDVPAWHLDWLIGQTWIDAWPELVRYIEANSKEIKMELEETNV